MTHNPKLYISEQTLRGVAYLAQSRPTAPHNKHRAKRWDQLLTRFTRSIGHQ